MSAELEAVEDARLELRRLKTARRLHGFVSFAFLPTFLIGMTYLTFVVQGDSKIGTGFMAFIGLVAITASLIIWFEDAQYSMVPKAQRKLDKAHEKLANSINPTT